MKEVVTACLMPLIFLTFLLYVRNTEGRKERKMIRVRTLSSVLECSFGTFTLPT